jgi:glycosyl transferase, family 25
MWEFIDKVIYINLDTREDRRKIMAKFFEEGKIPQDKIVRFSAFHIKRGIGCLKSHTKALQMAKDNGWKNVLILEDDLEWLEFEKGYEQLQELIKLPRWDVIQLVGWYVEYDFPRIYYTLNAGAYLVNSSYYDTLLANRYAALRGITSVETIWKGVAKFTADVYWNRLLKNDYWYGLYPCMCRQVNTYSDNLDFVYRADQVYGIYKPEDKSIFFTPIQNAK